MGTDHSCHSFPRADGMVWAGSGAVKSYHGTIPPGVIFRQPSDVKTEAWNPRQIVVTGGKVIKPLEHVWHARSEPRLAVSAVMSGARAWRRLHDQEISCWAISCC